MDIFISNAVILFFARLVLGTIMIYYGYPKIKDVYTNARETSDMGYKPGIFWGTTIALVEFLGGIAVIVGFYADIAAALYAFICITGTFWKIKMKSDLPDYSYDLILLALCATILGLGTGAFSLTPLSNIPFLHVYAVSTAFIFSIIFAYLPEILGKKYKEWRY